MNKKIMALGVVLFFCISSVSAYPHEDTIASLSYGNTYYVGGSGEGNFSTIQGAVDVASNGDTVFVFDDSSPYEEHVHIATSIRLIGEDKNTTVISSDDSSTISVITKNVVIRNLSIFNTFTYSIFVTEDNITVSDNIISERDNGVFLLHSSNCVVNNNEFRGGFSGIGIYLYNATYNKIENNTCRDGYFGIDISFWSNNNEVVDNCLENASFYIKPGSSPNVLSGNTVNGKPFLYLDEEHDVSFQGITAGQIILNHCTNVSIRNVTISKSTSGITLINSSDCLISDCVFKDNKGIAVSLDADDNIVADSVFENNSIGILSNYEPSQLMRITGNSFFNNQEAGVRLHEASVATIENNTFENNPTGMYLANCKRCTVIHNAIQHNTIGLFLGASPLNSIEENNLIRNGINAFFEKGLFGNRFSANYWEPSLHMGVKIILGAQVLIGSIPYEGEFTFFMPWLDFDWHQAKTPYDISTVQ
jgi:parallel beta-helix repeat protein